MIAGKKEGLGRASWIWDRLGGEVRHNNVRIHTCRGCDNQAIVWRGLVCVMVMHEKMWTFGV